MGGIISRSKAERATYIAVMLFFLTAVIGVGHNFYWIAKPTGVIALGSCFSTTQIFPLILLTLDAWKHMQMAEFAEEGCEKGKQTNIMKEVWLFLLGINFWNGWCRHLGLGGQPSNYQLLRARHLPHWEPCSFC